MRRRAMSLVVLVGFFALAAGRLTAHGHAAVAQQGTRKAVKSASDLPAFSYPVSGNPADLIRSEASFRPIAEKLRRDIETLLRDYSIEDQTTLRGLHDTLLSLDLLENRTEEARKELVIVRQLEDKPAARLMSGLVQEALLDGGGAKPDPNAFFRTFSVALNRLPWDVVSDQVKRDKAGFENLSESLLANLVETRYGATIRTNGQLQLAGVQGLATMRYNLAMRIPVRDKALEAFTSYIGAHNTPKPNIWPARSVTLDATARAKPVVIGIWDTGVDRSVFRGQLATDGPVPGFEMDGSPTQGELPVLDARQKEQWREMLSLLRGSVDRQAALDTPDAAAFLERMRTAKPEDVREMRASIRRAGSYVHGTHVAGIALEGNPFGRLVVVRNDEHPERVPPPPPTVAGITRFAAGAGELTAYLRKQGARVVNMSWVFTLVGFEQNLQANGVGADAAERRKMAQELLGALRDGLHKALASTPEILYVAGAGNSNSNTTFDEDVWASMIDLPNLIVAGAVDQAGNEASFTCFGPAVTVYSNGSQVESYVPGGERMRMSGTSMAAPNVTNLAAKLIALDPSLTPADVVKLIKDGSDLSADGRFRLINPKRSVELLQARMR